MKSTEEKRQYYIIKKGLHIETIEYYTSYKEICNIANLLAKFDTKYIIIDVNTSTTIFSN